MLGSFFTFWSRVPKLFLGLLMLLSEFYFLMFSLVMTFDFDLILRLLLTKIISSRHLIHSLSGQGEF